MDQFEKSTSFDVIASEMRKAGMGNTQDIDAVMVNPVHAAEGKCEACMIDPNGGMGADNLIATAEGYLGTLNHDQIRTVCKSIHLELNGRCSRARGIRQAAKECRTRFPDNDKEFFGCFIPAFRKHYEPSYSGR